MTETALTVTPFPDANRVRLPDGAIRSAPAGWTLVPPGDPGLTRRIKAGGPCWLVQEKKGRRTFSRGIWADAKRVQAIRDQLEIERSDPAYQRKQDAAKTRRDKHQASYVEDFAAAVRRFLDFPLVYDALAAELTQRITAHATPVGSGTVARTERIPIERRAESAVIAWLRHQTTAYDHMQIARVKGRRREVRRMLAERSRELLDAYRKGHAEDVVNCPLKRALARPAPSTPSVTATGKGREANVDGAGNPDA